MNIQQRLAFELTRRAGLLPQEVNELKALTDGNIQGMGIHQSQIATVKMILDELQEQQNEAVRRLDPALPADEFTEMRSDIEGILTATHSILATFRFIFAQRNQSPHYKEILDLADLIAADCYLTCIKLANKWRGLPSDHYREPPLTYLNAMLSPVAITRKHTLNKVGLQLYAEVEKQLPISVISLPFHDTVAVSASCSLYHEVGHLLDSDIGLSAELGKIIDAELKNKGATAARRASWKFWIDETIGDCFGVLLGGAAFGYALANMLYKPREDIGTLGEDSHPNEYVRIFLVAALLKSAKVEELTDTAKKIEDAWRDIYGDIANLAQYLPDCEVVADRLLNAKLQALNDHCLIELRPNMKNDHERIDELAVWLRDEVARPEPDNYPFRFVPAAAQLAAEGVKEEFEKRYEDIQKRALAFVALIDRPKFLDPTGISPRRKDHLNGLIKKINFRGFQP